MTASMDKSKAPKLKLASGKKLRRVSLKHLLHVQAALTANGKVGLFDETKNSTHFVVMTPRSINMLKKHVISTGLADIDEHARAFAECDTCPPWPEDEASIDVASQRT